MADFNPITERLDPASIPQPILYTGATMSIIVLGTFGSDHVSARQVVDAVRGSAAVGYRHFDCTSVSLRSRTTTAFIPRRYASSGQYSGGQIPIPSSVNPRSYLANLRSVARNPLTDQEMQQIASLDRNPRLINKEKYSCSVEISAN